MLYYSRGYIGVRCYIGIGRLEIKPSPNQRNKRNIYIPLNALYHYILVATQCVFSLFI